MNWDVRAFILLLSAHILADYLFQWPGLANAKNGKKLWALGVHGAIVFVTAILFSIYWLETVWLLALLVLSLSHIAIDWGKVLYRKKCPGKMFWAEVVDLTMHLLLLYLAVIFFLPVRGVFSQDFWISRLFHTDMFLRGIFYLAAVVFLTRGGTLFVRRLLDQIGKAPTKSMREIGFLARENAESESVNGEKEYNVGRVIGNLERLLLFLLVCLNNFAAIGFVIAAKSVARFKDLEDHQFAEYYLVGTLISTLVAIGTALAVKQLLLQI